MSESFSCCRCGGGGPRLEQPPMRGALGVEIQNRVCAYCWQEWQRAEVMVINELRLNFMDPAAVDILNAHLRQFLLLDPPASA
jgi:Fe-S cluster biosynthesis and repair protein YggX